MKRWVRFVVAVVLGGLAGGVLGPASASAVNPAPTAVTLTSSASMVSSTGTAVLTATPNRYLYSGEYRVGFYDVTGGASTRIGVCTSAARCTFTIAFARLRDGTGAPQTHQYLAKVEADSTAARVVATSPVRSVTPQPWAVTVGVTGSPVTSQGSATLTATANQYMYSGQYRVGFYDVTGTAPAGVGSCTNAMTCTVTIAASRLRDAAGAPQTHQYVARDETDNAASRVTATSGTQSVLPAPWAVTLAVTGSPVDSLGSATLTATVNQYVYSGQYRVGFYDVTTAAEVGVGSCTNATTCTFTIAASRLRDAVGAPQTHQYVARVETDTGTAKTITTSSTEAVAPVPWGVALAVTGSPVGAGGSATLKATTNQYVFSGLYQVGIYNTLTNSLVRWCVNTRECVVTVPGPGDGVAIYKAYLEIDGQPSRDGTGPAPVAVSAPVVVTSAGLDELALMGAPAVLELQRRLLAGGDQEVACLTLGEFIRTHAARSSVPDVTLICRARGLKYALAFAVGTSGLAAAIIALHEAADNPAPTDPHPDCDRVDATGACLDEGTPPAPAPDPQPDPAGAGIPPPPTCLGPGDRQNLLDGMPTQTHHVATEYGIWADTFQKLVDSYGLNISTGTWNLLTIPHKGPHPAEYHQWVLKNMRDAKVRAQGDVTKFLQYYKTSVMDKVENDPTIARLAYWKCYR